MVQKDLSLRINCHLLKLLNEASKQFGVKRSEIITKCAMKVCSGNLSLRYDNEVIVKRSSGRVVHYPISEMYYASTPNAEVVKVRNCPLFLTSTANFRRMLAGWIFDERQKLKERENLSVSRSIDKVLEKVKEGVDYNVPESVLIHRVMSGEM